MPEWFAKALEKAKASKALPAEVKARMKAELGFADEHIAAAEALLRDEQQFKSFLDGVAKQGGGVASVSRKAIESLANSYQKLLTDRPATVARLTLKQSNAISARSTSGNAVHQIVSDFFDSRQAHPHNLQCAEIDAISQAIRAHETATKSAITTLEQAKAVLNGSRMQTARVRPATGNRASQHGTSIHPCENGCDLLLQVLGIVFE